MPKVKIINGEKKQISVPKDPEKKILGLMSKEVEQQQDEIAAVKEQRKHAVKIAAAKQKGRDDRKGKRQKGPEGAATRASGGSAVAPLV
jgi:hypothetical protein